MRFKKLEIEGFRKIGSKTIDFSSGINVIKGLNEAGKSTIKHAILKLIFTKVTATSKEVTSLRMWGNKVAPKLFLEFTSDKDEYSLFKDFEKKETALSLGKDRLEDVNKVQTKVEGMFGLVSEGLFRATAYIDHASVSELESGKKEIKEVLSSAFTGTSADVDAQKILKKIRDNIADKERGLARIVSKPGKIKVLKDEIFELEKQLTDKRLAVSKLEKYSVELDRISRDLVEREEKCSIKKELYGKWEDKISKNAELNALRDQYDGLDRQNQMYRTNKERLDNIKIELGVLEKQAVSSEVIAEINRLSESISGIKAIIVEKENAPKEVKSSTSNKWWVIVVVGGLISVVGFFAMFKALAFASILIIGLLFIGYGIFKIIVSQILANNYEISVENNRKEIAGLRSRLEASEADLRQKLDDAKLSSVDQAIKAKEKNNALLNEKQTLDRLIDQGLFERNEKLMKDIRFKASSFEDILNKPDYKLITVLEEDFFRLKNEVNGLEADIRGLRDRQLKGKGFIEAIPVSGEEIVSLEEEIQARKEQLAFEDRRLLVFKLLDEMISAAYQSTLIPAKAILEEKISSYFSLITSNRYKKIEMDESTLEFKVFSLEKNDWIKVDVEDMELSRGTIDQFFLAARLALVDIISKDKNPPIFLDDPFITFDDNRLKATMAILKEIAKSRQILIFTCKNIYNEYAENVVEL